MEINDLMTLFEKHREQFNVHEQLNSNHFGVWRYGLCKPPRYLKEPLNGEWEPNLKKDSFILFKSAKKEIKEFILEYDLARLGVASRYVFKLQASGL